MVLEAGVGGAVVVLMEAGGVRGQVMVVVAATLTTEAAAPWTRRGVLNDIALLNRNTVNTYKKLPLQSKYKIVVYSINGVSDKD